MRPVELNEVKDGIVHLLKEICEVEDCFLYKECGYKKEDVLMIVVDYLCKNYNSEKLNNLCKKSIWEALTVLFLRIKTFDVEFYIDYIVDILIIELENFYHSLCGYQAEQFLYALVKGGVSKRTLKSKFKNKVKGKPELENIINKIFK
mgnify:CR=1 FL=1